MRRGLRFWPAPFVCQFLTAALLFACVVTAQAADTADETRAISREVSALLKARNYHEAEALANKGLALCDDAAGVRGFCLGQFNDSLGDVAYAQAQYPAALTFFQRAAEAREGIIGSENVLRFASQVRLGRTYLALDRDDEAEPLLKNSIAGLSRAAPVSPNLRTALESLRKLYADSGRIDEEVGVLRSELAFHEKADGGNAQTLLRAKLFLNIALVRQAKSLAARNSEADAERALSESIKLVDPPPPGAEKHLRVSLTELGVIYVRQRRYAEAEPLLLRSFEYHATLAIPPDPDLPVALVQSRCSVSKLGQAGSVDRIRTSGHRKIRRGRDSEFETRSRAVEAWPCSKSTRTNRRGTAFVLARDGCVRPRPSGGQPRADKRET